MEIYAYNLYTFIVVDPPPRQSGLKKKPYSPIFNFIIHVSERIPIYIYSYSQV